MIRNIIFDVGKVLVNYQWRPYMDTFGFTEDVYQRVEQAVFLNPDWILGDMGAVTPDEWLNLMISKEPALEKEIRAVYDGFGAVIEKFPYTDAWVGNFREKGYHLYYLSNFPEELHRKSYDTLRFLDDFDGGIFSWKVKCIKPEEKIYRLLLEQYHLKPEECLFYDDTAVNIEAAKKLGINAILFHQDIALQMLEK